MCGFVATVAFDGRPGEGARLEIQVPVQNGVAA